MGEASPRITEKGPTQFDFGTGIFFGVIGTGLIFIVVAVIAIIIKTQCGC
mgnify:CR=1 FL=1